ncbi:MAG: PRC-barrel domain-containing protein [Opitutus sp.]
MLYNAKNLTGYKLNSIDGEIGKVKEFYFDDRHWVVRYLVANTGTWLTDRQVLISPHALVAVTGEDQHIEVELTKKQIQDSPLWQSDKPVSRQFEESYYGYYGWPAYWGGDMLGYSPYPMSDREHREESTESKKAWDHHLRSTDAVRGYNIHGTDGEIGHVEDFIIDDKTWAIRYLIIDTRNWWPGKKVLVSPQWIERVSWNESKVFVKLSREAIKQSPEYTDESLLTREYETGLHRHYDRPGYWDDEAVSIDKTKSDHGASKATSRISRTKH